MAETAALQQYRQRMHEATAFVSLSGIPSADAPRTETRIPLVRLYVRLQAFQQETPRQADAPGNESTSQERADQSPFKEMLSTLAWLGEDFYRQGKIYRSLERPPALDPSDALLAYRRLMILGAPGSGKTTLLRYLAHVESERPDGLLPVFVSLRQYAMLLRGGRRLSLKEFAFRQAAGDDGELRDALAQTDRLLWLCDDVESLSLFRESVISEFAELPGLLALTSRPVGYRLAGFESVTHFELLPMSGEEVDRCIDETFLSLSEERQTMWDWAEGRTAWLKQQFARKPRLRGIIRQPLFLAYLCALSDAERLRELPEERAAFYEQCLETLIDMQAARHDAPPRAMLLDGLAYLGWHLHARAAETRPASAFARADAVNNLSRHLQTLSNGAAAQWGALAEQIARFWETCGMLQTWEHAGTTHLFFRHALFREFAAAKHLAALCSENSQLGWTWLSRRLHHDAWQEILLLCGDMLDHEHLAWLTRYILRARSPYERLLLRDVFLAARLLQAGSRRHEDMAQAFLACVTPFLKQRRRERAIASRMTFAFGLVALPFLLKLIPLFPNWGLLIAVCFWSFLWYAAFIESTAPRFQALFGLPERFWPHNPDRQPILQLLESCQLPDTIPFLVEALRDSQSDVRRIAAETLGAVGKKSVVPELFRLMSDPVPALRRTAAAAIKRLGDVASLVTALRDKQEDVREAAIDALSQIGDEQAIPELMSGLSDERADVRRIIMQSLRKIGGEQTVPSLIQALADSNKDIRLAAVDALGQLDSIDALYSRLRIVPGMVKMLDDPDPLIRWAAAAALGKIGDPDVIPFLTQALRKSQDFVRRAISDALLRLFGRLSPAQVVKFLRDTDAELRRIAAEYLGKLGKVDADALAALREALRDEHATVRREAAEAIGRLRHADSVPDLIAALDDEAWEMRWAATEALGKIGKPETVIYLVQRLDDTRGYVCRAAVDALGRIGNTAVVENLIQELTHEKPYIRHAARDALKKMGDAQIVPFLLQSLKYESDAYVLKNTENAINQISDANAIPFFLDALREDSERVRQTAAQALGRIGGAAAVSALIPLLRDASFDVRASAAAALGDMGDEQALPSLLELLRDPTTKLRRIAAKGLGRIGTPESVPALLTLLQDRHPAIRQAVVESLGRIGSSQAVPALINIVNDASYRERWAAAYALGRIRDRQAVAALAHCLESEEDENMRRAAAEALGEIGDAESVPALISALTDPGWFVRWAAAHALGQIHDAAAVPALLALLDDPHEKVRWATAEALGKLGDSRAAERLIAALNDPAWEVCQAAARALHQVCRVATIPALIEAMRQRNEFVRRTTAHALRRIETPDAIPYLMQAIRSEEAFIRAIAAEQIVHLRTVNVMRPLIKLLGDRNREARKCAAEMIGDLAHIVEEPKLLKRAAHFLWWRLTDVDDVAKASFHALKQVANRLSVLGVIREHAGK